MWKIEYTFKPDVNPTLGTFPKKNNSVTASIEFTLKLLTGAINACFYYLPRIV